MFSESVLKTTKSLKQRWLPLGVQTGNVATNTYIKALPETRGKFFITVRRKTRKKLIACVFGKTKTSRESELLKTQKNSPTNLSVFWNDWKDPFWNGSALRDLFSGGNMEKLKVILLHFSKNWHFRARKNFRANISTFQRNARHQLVIYFLARKDYQLSL